MPKASKHQKEEEVWKDIEGYEGCYQISSLGRVKSLPRGKGSRSHPHILAPRYDGKGYTRVQLFKHNKGTDKKVHRLVAYAFLGEPPEGRTTINHIDGKHDNNRVSNLEWTSQLENNLHSIHVLKNRYVAIAKYDKELRHIKDYESVTAASKDTGAEMTNIVKACRDFPNKTCAGFIWKYISKPHGKRALSC